VYLILKTGKKRLERQFYLICSILNEHFFVQVIHTSLYDARDFCDYKAIELLGTQENVLMAEYVYHFLLNQTRMLWETHRREKPSKARSRNSYVLGVLSGFRDKLDAHRKTAQAKAEAETRTSSGSVALALTEDRQLENFVSFRYPRLVRTRQGRTLRDAHAFEAGRQAGWSLVLHKGINASDGNGGKLLR
jgi:hypothetical protein